MALPERLENWLAPLGDLIGPVYPWISGIHILGIGCLVGAILLLDLRLLGAFRSLAVFQIAGPAIRIAGTGLVVAVSTGFLLFSGQPAHYLANPAFVSKLAILAIGVMNLTILHRSRAWVSVMAGGPVTPPIRTAAAISLVTWIAAVFAGRWIAFL